MRSVLAFLIAITFLTPAVAAPPRPAEVESIEAILRWISAYKIKPDAEAVPGVIRLLSQRGAFRDPDSAGIYVGFLAGVLESNPRKVHAILAGILPLPFEDQWLVIRAIAYSSLPIWKDLLRDLAAHVPDRQVLIDRYLTGKLPILANIALEQTRPTAIEKITGVFSVKKPQPSQVTFESNPDLIDTLWGVYFATGDSAPIGPIIRLLPWSKDRDSIDKLTIGSMAKYTLASNASRDPELLGLLKRLRPNESKSVARILEEVIEAAETVDTGRIRKDALAAVDELRRKGPGARRNRAWWGKIAETTISLGCIGAAVAGQVELGLPCVIGGALSSAGLNYMSQPQ